MESGPEQTTLGDGDPRTFAPRLYSQMSRLEQGQIVNYYERRLAFKGRGDARFPDNQEPAAIARRAFLQGTFVVFFFIRATPLLLVGAAAISFINYGDRNAASIGVAIVCGSGVLALLAVWVIRVIQIRRYFSATSATPDVLGSAQVLEDRIEAVQVARWQHAAVLFPSLAGCALVSFGLYHGPFLMKAAYALWFGLLVQALVWRSWRARTDLDRPSK